MHKPQIYDILSGCCGVESRYDAIIMVHIYVCVYIYMERVPMSNPLALNFKMPSFKMFISFV